jgi:pimeloyl-ACP methyl ester carboxylesterase
MSRKKWVGLVVFLLVTMGGGHFVRNHFAAEEKMWRTRVREALQQQFHDTFVALRAEYGLRPFVPTGREYSDRGRRVILIHGLDDPGIVWQDLAPALAEEGYRVWIMSYPNDQPVRDSAAFFYRQLKDFASLEGTDPVAVVCHSMGGLVTREMLTDPEIGYGAAKEAKQVPPLSHFIMVGTPNHGSVFSRLRFMAEIRDQLVSGGTKGYHWLRSIFDGVGEAGIDIYPDSDFLRELNSRPLPDAGRMLVIAGIMSPVDKIEVEGFLRDLRASIPDRVQPPQGLESILNNMIDEIGDGLVSVESAKLPGIPLVQVQGTHLTIIRNIGANSSRIPPAVPVIQGELSKEQ